MLDLSTIFKLYPDTQRQWGRVDEKGSAVLPPSQASAGAMQDVRNFMPPSEILWSPVQYPEADPRMKAIDALAIMGAVRLGEWIGCDISWDGTHLRGPRNFALARVLIDFPYEADDAGHLHWRRPDRWFTRSVLDPAATVGRAPKNAAKIWVGQVTAASIWGSCRWALVRMAMVQEGEREYPEVYDLLDSGDPEGYQATGYDGSQVLDFVNLGWGSHKFDGRKVRSRYSAPALEMLAMIGASEIERCDRWSKRREPDIPDPTGIPIRDGYDLGRFAAYAPSLRGVHAQAAGEYRVYLRAS